RNGIPERWRNQAEVLDMPSYRTGGMPRYRLSPPVRPEWRGREMKKLLCASASAAALAIGLAPAAGAAEKVTFMSNWLAQAEHGGYYQAVADGFYAECGLDVTIQQGGPQVAGRPLLLAGKIDFYMGGNMQQAYDAV